MSRRRTLPLFLAGTSVGATAMITAVTISAIAAERMTGRPELAGAPVAASVLGTAFGTSWWSAVFERRSKAFALRAAYVVGVLGSLAAVGAVILGIYPLLVLALFVLGTANGATQLTRYLAADLFPESHRGRALSWVVWMGTIGAILGPMLMAPTAAWAETAGVPGPAGSYAASALLFGLAALIYLTGLAGDHPLKDKPASHRQQPAAEARNTTPTLGASRRGALASLLRNPIARLAILCLVVGQMVMVFVMTMTPIHLQHENHGLGIVGWIISGHIVGMFALSPAVGWLVDRLGPRLVLGGGQMTLAVAATLAATRPENLWALGLALYLLGLGWNLCFVSGSSLLDSSLSSPMRALKRGWGDTTVWVAAATASLGSSFLYGATSFPTLCLISLVLIAIAFTMLVTQTVTTRAVATSG